MGEEYTLSTREWVNGWMNTMDGWITISINWFYFLYSAWHSRLTMASHKITKLAGAKPTDEFELSIAQALVDLENNVADLKKELRPLSITAAKEVIQHFPLSRSTRHDNICILKMILDGSRSRLVVARRPLSSLSLFLSLRLSTRSNKGNFIIEW